MSNCESQDKLRGLPICSVYRCVCVIGQVVQPTQCVSVHQLSSEKTAENRKETGGKWVFTQPRTQELVDDGTGKTMGEKTMGYCFTRPNLI